jgi:NAD-dependent deacetylase
MSDIELAAQALASAHKIVCFSGAGISAESGIPTYRDKMTGLWERYSPQELETAKAFRENPKLIWGWYLWRRKQAAQAQPNAAHSALNNMVSLGKKVSVITQNIDDLHERAGSQDVVHLHGNLNTPKCFACHRPADMAHAEAIFPEEGALIDPPRCGRCGGKLRPGVVWYGENLPKDAWKSAMSLVKDCDVLISVGTSGVVFPAAKLPDIALSAGSTVIHVNTHDVGLGNSNELMLIGRASEVLPQLYAAMASGA